MTSKNKGNSQNRVALTKGRGGGQGQPRTPSGERRTWKPPTGNSTPSNRGKTTAK